jgi:hypothetical protein
VRKGGGDFKGVLEWCLERSGRGSLTEMIRMLGKGRGAGSFRGRRGCG